MLTVMYLQRQNYTFDFKYTVGFSVSIETAEFLQLVVVLCFGKPFLETFINL